MTISSLRKLYFSRKARCSICGCELEDNTGYGLGSIFVLDNNGRFYCANCDCEFEDYDERIFEPDIYCAEDEDRQNAIIALSYILARDGYEVVDAGLGSFKIKTKEGYPTGLFKNLLEVADALADIHAAEIHKPVTSFSDYAPEMILLAMSLFLESDYCRNILKSIDTVVYWLETPDYDEAKLALHTLLDKEIAQKIISTESAYVMIEHLGRVWLSEYDTYTDPDKMKQDIDTVLKEGKYVNFNKMTMGDKEYDVYINCYAIPVMEFKSYEEIVAREYGQITEDMCDIGLTDIDSGEWSFYLSLKELLYVGIPFATIEKELAEEGKTVKEII